MVSISGRCSGRCCSGAQVSVLRSVLPVIRSVLCGAAGDAPNRCGESDRVFRADAAWLQLSEQNAIASYFAHQYWSGLPTPNPKWELVLDTAVCVLEELTSAKTKPASDNAGGSRVSFPPLGQWRQYHRLQTCPAPHTAHLRAWRRTWRLVVLATQTPPTRVLPTPHPTATCVVMPSG